MTAKYVILEDRLGMEFPYLFSPIVKHDDFARPFIAQGMKAVGAGFATIAGEGESWKVSCYGKSLGLSLESRGERDSVVFNSMFKRP